MGAFNAVNLDELPPPEIVEKLNYEDILTSMKNDLITRDSNLASTLQLESEPLVKLLEVCAYRELMLRQRINDASRSVMLAYASGPDLDQLAALLGVERLVTRETDEGVILSIPIIEDDQRLRHRTQLSLEGHSTAGSKGSYVYWALSASARVKDIEVVSPESAPGTVNVTVLSTDANGIADDNLLDAVTDQLNAADVRPLTDSVFVASANIIEYQIEASLDIYAGPDQETVRQLAEDTVRRYVADQHRLGESIYRSGLLGALHQPGVKRVILAQPANDIDVLAEQAAYCNAVKVMRGASS